MVTTDDYTPASRVVNDVRDAARAYLQHRWQPIPIAHKSKKVTRPGWQNERRTLDDVDRDWPSDQMNVGVLLGEASGWLVDIDLDCPEALRVAKAFLPDTAARFGRATNPESHWLYIAEVATQPFVDPTDKKKLLEVRSTGTQTVFPPSAHEETGETVEWVVFDQPFEVDADELLVAVAKVATAALLARHWPKVDGSRHDIALALAGGLLRAGWSVEEAELFIYHVATAAGDPEVRDRVRAVESTAMKLRQRQAVTGWTRLSELVDVKVVARVCDWLRVSSADDADDADAKNTDSASSPSSGNKKKPRTKEPPAAQVLTGYGRQAELWTAQDSGEAYATFAVDGHRETATIANSKAFKSWLRRRFYEDHGKPPPAQALADALAQLEAAAMFDGASYPVWTRVGEVDGRVYLDLADPAWRVAEVSRDGWRVLDAAPPSVRFRRRKGQLALPAPTPGGSLSDLRPFVNAPEDGGDGDEAWTLLAAWLVGAMKPRGPYTVLILGGEQGSGKSTTAKMLRSIVDPSLAMLRALPRDERDFVISASASWIVAFDNLSSIPDWLSDGLCRLSTGGGFSARQLYSDDEEALFDFQRPTLVNGISDLAERSDLVDRSLVVTLPRLVDVQTELDLWSGFFKARPRILGALLSAVSVALRNQDQIDAVDLPRMADFALWLRAAEHEPSDAADDESRVFAWNVGTFDKVYADNRKAQVAITLEADILAPAVKKMMAATSSGEFEGTATELLAALANHITDQTARSRAWPKSPRVLSGKLRRIASFLRQEGVDVSFYTAPDRQKTRKVRIVASRKGQGSENADSSVRSVRNVRRPALCERCEADPPVREVDGLGWICADCFQLLVGDDAAEAVRG